MRPKRALSNSKFESSAPEQVWKIIVDGKEQMNEGLFSTFITETLGLAEDSLLQFYILTLGMKTPKLGHIKYQNFQYLFTFAKCKNIKELKKSLPRLEKDMNEPKTFKEMYNQIFEAFLIKNLSMDFDYAQSLWTVLLRDKFKYQKQFNLYLQSLGNKKPLKCHKDLWHMMYEFSITVKDAEKDFSEADAWPVFLDNFVEFMKAEGLIK